MVPGPGGPTNEDRTVNNSDDDLRQAIALFRYGVIADLVHLPLGTKGMVDKMRDKAGQPYTIPGTNRTRVAAETIRGWIKLYRYGGFDALYPKPRTDRGQPRRLPPEVAERLIALKTDNPTWSVRAVIRAARDGGVDHPLAPSKQQQAYDRHDLRPVGLVACQHLAQSTNLRSRQEALPPLAAIPLDALARIGSLRPVTVDLGLAHDDRQDRRGSFRRYRGLVKGRESALNVV